MGLRGRSSGRVYEVGRRIAVGGMGEVYEATAPDMKRRVAVKRVLKSHESRDLKDLFFREVAVAAALEHPNVVEVLDAGIVDGDLYLIMEFVEGASLAEMHDAFRLAGRRFPVEMACGIVAQIARGLAHAHERSMPDGTPLGIVHRDIALENVLISKSGLPKLVDFGLATLAGHDFTNPGTIRGRPRFLSPEHARGERLDARSDIFSLGALTFEILAGAPLYTEQNLASLLWRVTEGAYEPLETRLPDADPDLLHILRSALAVDPRDRMRSARELERALDGFRAARGMRVESAAIGRTLVELAPFILELRAEKDVDGPGMLENTTLVLSPDRLDPASLAPTAGRATERTPRPAPSLPGSDGREGTPKPSMVARSFERIERIERTPKPALTALARNLSMPRDGAISALARADSTTAPSPPPRMESSSAPAFRFNAWAPPPRSESTTSPPQAAPRNDSITAPAPTRLTPVPSTTGYSHIGNTPAPLFTEHVTATPPPRPNRSPGNTPPPQLTREPPPLLMSSLHTDEVSAHSAPRPVVTERPRTTPTPRPEHIRTPLPEVRRPRRKSREGTWLLFVGLVLAATLLMFFFAWGKRPPPSPTPPGAVTDRRHGGVVLPGAGE